MTRCAFLQSQAATAREGQIQTALPKQLSSWAARKSWGFVLVEFIHWNASQKESPEDHWPIIEVLTTYVIRKGVRAGNDAGVSAYSNIATLRE